MIWALKWIGVLQLLLGAFTSNAMSLAELQPGDVLIQSQRCYLCRLIEIEEGLPVSHVGIVNQMNNGTWVVHEAWGSVQTVAIEAFLSRRTPQTKTWVRRPKLNRRMPAREIRRRFENYFLGLSYDPDFLWENRDEKGQTLYCSELIVKFFNGLWIQAPKTKAMHYQKNREAWIRYFKGTPPDGLPGISPADLLRSPALTTLGEIEFVPKLIRKP